MFRRSYIFLRICANFVDDFLNMRIEDIAQYLLINGLASFDEGYCLNVSFKRLLKAFPQLSIIKALKRDNKLTYFVERDGQRINAVNLRCLDDSD